MKEVLITGFKGKNNTSSSLVSLLPTPHKILLTNSFSGLYKDIKCIHIEQYESVIMFGIDKALTDCVRIEKTAAYNGKGLNSSYHIADLTKKLAAENIKYEISSTPAKYFCNAAYFYMLSKCPNSVFIHIPSLRGMTPSLLQQLKYVFSAHIFALRGIQQQGPVKNKGVR